MKLNIIGFFNRRIYAPNVEISFFRKYYTNSKILLPEVSNNINRFFHRNMEEFRWI